MKMREIKRKLRLTYQKILLSITSKEHLHKMIKKRYGLVVGNTVVFNKLIDYGNLNSFAKYVSIGNNVMIAERVKLLMRDTSKGCFIEHKSRQEIAKNGNIVIGNNVFIGYGAIILPNTTICDNVIIGAGSVVSRSLIKSGVYVGNPAQWKKNISNYEKVK